MLEIGTAIGYSSAIFSEYLAEDGKIDTLEISHKAVLLAKANHKMLGVENKINIIEGDALELLPTLKEKYDVIFIYGPKSHYIQYLPYLWCIRKMLTRQVKYDKLICKFDRGAKIISKLSGTEQLGELKGLFAEVIDVCSCIDCWSAIKYVSDCHDSGALSFCYFMMIMRCICARS